MNNQTRAESEDQDGISFLECCGEKTTVAVFYKWGLCSASSHRSGRSSGLWTSSFCNIDIMVSSAKQLLVFALFLCGLEESVLSLSGRCTDNQCFAVFVNSTDHTGAQKSCERFLGQLFEYNLTILTDIFKSVPSGEFWLEQKEAVATPQTCSSIAVSTEQTVTQARVPCHKTLSGFLCQYPLEDPCGEFKSAGGSQVIYTAPMAFEVRDSQTFPMGTIAEVIAAGSKHLESKHVCFSREWLKAPWNCEVMDGGCERDCNKTTNTCTCPAGQSLNSNGVTCEGDPCARCAQGYQQEGDAHVCGCKDGYRLKPDGKSCEDVNECEDKDRCTGEGEQCVNVEGSFACSCRDGFVKEEEACVNVSICFECEHMHCVKTKGFYECVCREGYQVRETDPTKCDRHCTESQCPPMCDRNSEGQMQCFCPVGYILDQSNNSSTCVDINECEMGEACEHTCVNTSGGFRCSCFDGFVLRNEYKCLPVDDGKEEGSATTASYPIPATAQPALVPPYIKAGSALGITVFLLLCAALLFFLIHNCVKRCRRFDLTSLKHPNIDIFHLQQVTTETYKRLSF